MGIFIRATQDKQIKISGTDITLNEVYMRIEFAARANGITLEIAPTTFATKQTYSENKPLYTDVITSNLLVDLQPNETQTIDNALNYTAMFYTQLGYDVVIDTL
jgi:hypothetical protein